MAATGRDRVWSLCIRIARSRHDRGYLSEFSPETVITAASDDGLDVSARTVRRVLAAMTETGILQQTSDDPLTFRLSAHLAGKPRSRDSATDMSPGTRSGGDVGPTTDMSPASEWAEYADAGSDGLGLTGADDLLIYHLWADTGVEAEPLSAYGHVVRVGIDPQETRFGHVIQGDATRPPLSPDADLVVCHPPCQRWSRATKINGDPDDWPNQIPDARRVAQDLGDHYIIENVPEAPLREPVYLSGRMFGLPIDYRRAFETSFHVEQPAETADLTDPTGPFADENGQLGDWRGSKPFWRTAKQVTGDYPASDLKKSGIPAPYVHYLIRWFLRSRADAPGGEAAL